MLHLQTMGRHYEKAGEKITCDTQAPDDGMRRLPPPGSGAGVGDACAAKAGIKAIAPGGLAAAAARGSHRR
jgi:hypothetical protein